MFAADSTSSAMPTTLASEPTVASTPVSTWQKALRGVGFIWLLGWFWGYFLVLFPVYVALLWVPSNAGRNRAHNLNKLWGRILLSVTGVRIGLDPASAQRESLPDPVIYVSNHRSYLDIPILHLVLRGQYRFLGKRELGLLPLFGFMFRRLHVIHDRQNPAAAVASLRKARTLLEDSLSLVIFPEGTSKTPGRLGGFKEGAFILAFETGIPIVPIAISGSRDCFSPLQRAQFSPGKVSVWMGSPIQPASFKDVNALRDTVRSTISEHILQLH